MVVISLCSDPDLLARLDAQIFDSGWGPTTFDNAKHRVGLIAFLQDEPVGYAWLQVLDSEIEILRIGCLASYRRRGIGLALLQAVFQLDRFGLMAPERIWLEVASDNLAAQALYLGNGFVLVGRRPNYYGKGQDALNLIWSRS
ncbi:MAG: GNAT family N-acetyltransferase [Acidobacteria bacterium]|nr:GNAT family N-acetyltransferase [Acidobacteriota bacterium]